MFTQRDNLIILTIHLKGYNQKEVKYFLNDKNIYLEYETKAIKQILRVTQLYKIDVYESKLDFLVDYVSFVLKKDKDSLNWKDIGTYQEVESFVKEDYDIK